jgi:putative methionine-R-sulfoxide reductase with GAF domain
MRGEDELYPALGHTPQGRQDFRIPIDESFSGLSYRQGRIIASGKLSEDDRFRAHPRARRPYESIVSVPLCKYGEVDGVFNVVATRPDAFSVVDRTYISLLGSVIDVARVASDFFDEAGLAREEPVDVTPEHPAD